MKKQPKQITMRILPLQQFGYYIKAESRTCDGRIDAVTETGAWIYPFEFKLDRDKSALEQIAEQAYF